MMDGTWGVISGRVPRPIMPNAEDLDLDTARPALKKLKKKLKRWEKCNEHGHGRILLNIDSVPIPYVQHLTSGADVWANLKTRYKLPSGVIQDGALADITLSQLHDFESIGEYADYVKSNALRYANEGDRLPDDAAFGGFLCGLPERYKDHVRSVVLSTQSHGKEMVADELIVQMIGFERREALRTHGTPDQ